MGLKECGAIFDIESVKLIFDFQEIIGWIEK